MLTRCALMALWALAVALPEPASAQGDLQKARALYNSADFDAAIEAASAAKSRPAAEASATLIAARARLERYRRLGNSADLAAARAELVSLSPRTLAAQEIIEWQIGLGSALFFENQFGPAAEMFGTALPSARTVLTPVEFEKLLEWWASTVSRVAESLTGDARRATYSTMRDVIRAELERNPQSRPATYWSPIAARGAGELDAAWDSAVAGWIRAGSHPQGDAVRAELDKFVTETLIPERAQARTGQRLDAKPTLVEAAAMTEEWRALVARWQHSSTP